jgi:hypothetical protein
MNVVGRHLALHEDVDVVEFPDLLGAVVHHPDPRRQTGKLGLSLDTPTEHPGRFGETDGVAPIPK